MSDWPKWSEFPKSQTRAAKGGIRAQSQRGKFAQKWWAARWISVLESFELGARLQRGRSYARRGQVLSIAIESGAVVAQVQGSRPKPYAIQIAVKPLSSAKWNKLAECVANQAIFAAKLMAGEMPQDIEHVFKDAGLSLFPERQSDLVTNCSCPDWSNPCKHVAAVYYLLGEEFDRDPFLIFQLRGMSREQFLGLLGEHSGPAVSASEAELPPEPLSASLEAFWRGGALPENLVDSVGVTASGAALPKRLGKFPFWRGRADFLGQLDAIYRAAAEKAAETLTRQGS